MRRLGRKQHAVVAVNAALAFITRNLDRVPVTSTLPLAVRRARVGRGSHTEMASTVPREKLDSISVGAIYELDLARVEAVGLDERVEQRLASRCPA